MATRSDRTSRDFSQTMINVQWDSEGDPSSASKLGWPRVTGLATWRALRLPRALGDTLYRREHGESTAKVHGESRPREQGENTARARTSHSPNTSVGFGVTVTPYQPSAGVLGMGAVPHQGQGPAFRTYAASYGRGPRVPGTRVTPQACATTEENPSQDPTAGPWTARGSPRGR